MVNLVLGTATFGTGYGIANKGKRVNSETVRDIIKTAEKLGIVDFDTAPAYGPAEALLGEFLNPKFFPKVSSKISKENCKSVKLMILSVKETLRRSKVEILETLYLHDSEILSEIGAQETIVGLVEIKNLGLAKNIGISTYELSTLLRFKERFPQLNTFQVPENILDRRMFYSQDLLDLSKEGNKFIVRSIFLQGLLLMSLEDIPIELERAKLAISQLKAFSDSKAISPLALCPGYGQLIPWAAGVVIGAASAAELIEIVDAKELLPKEWESELQKLPEDLADPREWTK